MTKVIEKYTPMEILGNEELQRQAKEEMLQRANVKGNVNEIINSPSEGYTSICKVAELYEVAEAELFSLFGAEELEGEVNILVSKMNMIQVGFLLTESEVAQELRNQVKSVRDAI
ncbi:hypothetical protein [Rossellomorea sp. NRS-1567]|uniref:hypothetical protein n=1 Tax=Rossellomorea sp. NRS-1567 TaxID=3233901 RepID=UPI003D2A157A